MNRISQILLLAAAVLSLASCNPNTWKNINYLQDVQADTTMRMAVNKGVIIQPQDQLTIIVNSRDPKMEAQFNKSIASVITGAEVTSTRNQRMAAYVVDNEGNINFPYLGILKVSGLNRWQLQTLIEEELSSSGLLNDAIVTVDFLNFKISVLGEVVSPGSYTVNSDKITILQALSLSRDLTIHGRRDNIQVIREKNGRREIYFVDLRSSDLFKSPAYYLQQNDVVYVTPDTVRAGQSTINENYFKSGSFWISLASISMTTVNFIIALSNRIRK